MTVKFEMNIPQYVHNRYNLKELIKIKYNFYST